MLAPTAVRFRNPATGAQRAWGTVALPYDPNLNPLEKQRRSYIFDAGGKDWPAYWCRRTGRFSDIYAVLCDFTAGDEIASGTLDLDPGIAVPQFAFNKFVNDNLTNILPERVYFEQPAGTVNDLQLVWPPALVDTESATMADTSRSSAYKA
jgi:hypothetical protein